MSIAMTKYVNARSGVGGGAAVRSRELILRIITPSVAILPGESSEFNNLQDVGEVFAVNTPEYQYALKYFGFVSKLSTGARRLSMARWTKSATAPIVQGAAGITGATRLGQIAAATTLNITIHPGNDDPDVVVPLTLNLTAANTYEAVRAAIQTSIRTNTNPQLAQANVLYTASAGVFTLTGGNVEAGATLTVNPATNPAEDVGALIGWTQGAGGVSIKGYDAQSPLEAITTSANSSDNFGSFGFIDSTSNPPLPLTAEQQEAVAAWNHAQNNKFLYLTPTTVADAPARYDALRGFSGTALTISGSGYDFAEFCPGEVLASTNYSRANASTNYMYVSFGNRVPQVTDTPTSDRMDAVRANYVGQTMTAGQRLSFYQRGVLMGDATAAVDMNVYCNEMWFKDDLAASIMGAFLGLPRIPANDLGRALLLTNMQATIDVALVNGTISVGRLLDAQQRAYVTLATDDPDAWQQIQNIGYWVDVTIVPVATVDGRTEYVAQYLLLYAKDDQIRKVEGSDTLI